MPLIKTDCRFAICIAYWSTEQEAQSHAARVRKAGDKYQGGWADGARCGREPSRDSPGSFAVTYDTTRP